MEEEDTTIYQSGCDIDNLNTTVNQELNKIYNWWCANKLCLNVIKTLLCL